MATRGHDPTAPLRITLGVLLTRQYVGADRRRSTEPLETP